MGVLMLVLALVLYAASATAQTTERVSLGPGGAQANGVSAAPAISGDGRYVAFQSDATDLVSGDTNGATDIFVHDRNTGTTTRVSVSSAGAQANGASSNPAISADGRYVAFQSLATNLVPGDTNGVEDVFVHDRDTGTTTRVSVSGTGTQLTATSAAPALSADGRYVAFLSPPSFPSSVLIYDSQSGVTSETPASLDHALSGDGRYLAWLSDWGEGGYAVMLHDRQTSQTTQVTSPYSYDFSPSLSGDGRFLAYVSGGSGGGPPSNATVCVWDRQTDQSTCVPRTPWTPATDGHSSRAPAISSNGRYVAFESRAATLVPDDTNGYWDILVHDQDTGQRTRLSVATGGAQANGDSEGAAISADGRYVAFASAATNLVPGDTNGFADIFVRDRDAPMPDLVVETLSVTPDPATAGQATTLTAIVRNQGEAPAGACQLQAWRHHPATPLAGDAPNLVASVDPLDPDETQTFTDTFTPNFPGARTAHALVDAQDDVLEGWENNNRASCAYSIDPSAADLTFQTFEVTPDPVSLGNQATINATIVNQGTDPAPSCRVELWRHRAYRPVLRTTGDFTHMTDPLGPGETQTLMSAFYPHYQGERTAWGVVDSLNLVAESDEENNKASDTYTIVPGTTADLVSTVTMTPDPVTLGNAVTMGVEVENIGTVPARSSGLGGWHHRDVAPIVGSASDVAWVTPFLPPGGTSTVSDTFTPNYPGPRTAWALADFGNVVIENNEGNNVSYDRYGIVTGDEPDLVGTISVTPDPVAAGTTATLTVTVDNTGSSAAGPFTLAAWRHRSSAPGPATTPEVTWPMIGLGTAATVTVTDTFTPNYAGSRTAWVFADQTQAVLETNEANNLASDAYTIGEVVTTGTLAVTGASATVTRGGQVEIAYSLSTAADVRLRVRNIAGRLVARVAAGKREAGANNETWNGLSADGLAAPAGLYLVEILARDEGGHQARAVARVQHGH